jgi:hypothetical protein
MYIVGVFLTWALSGIKIYHFFGKISNFFMENGCNDRKIKRGGGGGGCSVIVSENQKLFSFFRISFGIKAIGTLVRFEFEGNIM